MPDEIRFDDLARMLRGAIGKVRDGREELSRLDSCGGDGDHGTTMVRAMGSVAKRTSPASRRRVQEGRPGATTSSYSDVATA